MSPPTLTAGQRAGLRRVGDLLIPGDAELPSFSASGCAEHADRLLASLYEEDRRGVKQLLGLCRFLPRFVLRALLSLARWDRRLPGFLGAALRLVELGLKGVVMTLYYADLTPGGAIHKRLGWDPRVLERSAEALEREAARAPEPESRTRAPAQPTAPTPAEAMARARQGQQALRGWSPRRRARLLGELRRVVWRRREEIVERVQAETHKSRSDALVSEIFGVLDNLAWLERHAPRWLRARRAPTPPALLGKQSWLWYEPAGTVLVIAPWNYPFYQALVPIAWAFAAGNTVVFKPSEWTPLQGLVEDLLSEAGFAPAWVQVVYGDGGVGTALVAARPDKIFFTGSTRTGRRILGQAADGLVPVDLELGGKDAMLVFDDVHLDRAVAGAAWGALTTCGQSCTSVERLFVQESIYDAFREALVAEVERLVQGVDRDGDADLGEMTTDFQVKIVARHLEDARAKGARVLTGDSWDGRSPRIPPIVLDGLRDDMLVAREETFGPLLCLRPFRTEEEAIRLANDSEMGLTASVWSRDLTRARRVARALAVGGVSINNVMATEANPALPFGGVRQSGFGRYKGEMGLHAFCNVKSLLVDKDSARREPNWYPYTREKYRLFTDLLHSLFGGRRRHWLGLAFTALRLDRLSQRSRPSPPKP